MLLASSDVFLRLSLVAGGCDCDDFRCFFCFGAVFCRFGCGGTMVQVKPSNFLSLATASQMRFRLDTRAEVGVSFSMIAPGRGVFMASVWGVARTFGVGGLSGLALLRRAIAVLRVDRSVSVVSSGSSRLQRGLRFARLDWDCLRAKLGRRDVQRLQAHHACTRLKQPLEERKQPDIS